MLGILEHSWRTSSLLNTLADFPHLIRQFHLFSGYIVSLSRGRVLMPKQERKPNKIHSGGREQRRSSGPKNMTVQFLTQRSQHVLLAWRRKSNPLLKMGFEG
jgi:hypothetical protein